MEREKESALIDTCNYQNYNSLRDISDVMDDLEFFRRYG
jgi:uncharacterized protein YpbB